MQCNHQLSQTVCVFQFILFSMYYIAYTHLSPHIICDEKNRKLKCIGKAYKREYGKGKEIYSLMMVFVNLNWDENNERRYYTLISGFKVCTRICMYRNTWCLFRHLILLLLFFFFFYFSYTPDHIFYV